MSETSIQTEIRGVLNGRHGLTLWRNNVGAIRKGGRFVRYGLAPGSADLIGIASPSGRFVAIEVKMPGGSADPHQRVWLDAVLAAGGIAGVAHSVKEALMLVQPAETGARP